MKNIPLSVLDAYAQRLTSKQAHMLYENKMQKPYKKALYENNAGKQLYKLYLDDYTIAEEVEMNKIEFLMKLNEKLKLFIYVFLYSVFFLFINISLLLILKCFFLLFCLFF